MRKPLLIKGFYSNSDGSGSTNAALAAGTYTWSNALPKNRGRLVGIYGLAATSNEIFTQINHAPVGRSTLKVGGSTVWENKVFISDLLSARPGRYFSIPLIQNGGQTLDLSLVVVANTPSYYVLANFENDYDKPQIRQAIMYSTLKQRTQDFTFTLPAGGGKPFSDTVTIPTGKGNIVAVEIISAPTSGAGIDQLGTFTLTWDGMNILEEVPVYMCQTSSTRELMFPFLSESGVNIQILNPEPVLNDTQIVVRVYFDDMKPISSYGC